MMQLNSIESPVQIPVRTRHHITTQQWQRVLIEQTNSTAIRAG